MTKTLTESEIIEIAIKVIIKRLFRQVYNEKINKLKKDGETTLVQSIERWGEDMLDEKIKLVSNRMVEALASKKRFKKEKFEKIIKELAEEIINRAINKKIKEIRSIKRSHTDDLIEDFLEVGLPPHIAQEFAERFIDEGLEDKKLFARKIEEVAEEYLQERPDYKKLSKHNNRDRVYNIGCDWQGAMDVVEYEDDRIYVPTSGYCIFKCIEKFLNKKFDKSGIHKYAATLKGMRLWVIKNLVRCFCEKKHKPNCTKPSTCNCQKEHSSDCQKLIDETLAKLPIIVKYGEFRGKIGFHPVAQKSRFKNKDCAIVLVPFGDSYYHAILSKINYKELTEEDLDKVRLEASKELVTEFRKLPRQRIKKKQRKIYVYDVETYVVVEKKKKKGKEEEEILKLIPYALGWAEVDLVSKTISPVTIIEGDSEEYIYNTMFKQIASLPDSPEEIQLFAHNGSRFDHIFAKAATNVVFESQIVNGSQIKGLRLRCGGKTFILKDSMLFTQKGLDKSAEALGIDDKKIDLDIKEWPKERFQQDRSWVPYLEKDVELLAKVIIKFEEILKEFGESVTRYFGLPGLAWAMINKTCTGVSELWVPAHNSMTSFIKASVYGGRVLHWKQEIKEEYICLDANSLYPSAMGTSSFPLGPAKEITDFSKFPQKKHVHYIVECEIEAPKHRYPIHPYRKLDDAMIFRIGRFTGVYNEVDLKEMKRDGYKILRYIRGIYWSRSAKIFDDFVTRLYNKRVEVGSDTPLGYVLKILLNAGYGKFLEVVDTNSTFKKSKTGKEMYSIKLPNGQTEYRNRLYHPIVNKPIHIGSYVLSYSRKIMNELINAVGRENIAYGDTDSIYVKKSVLPKVEKYLGNGLCKFKNDYGDKVITYGIFLDNKRYYLEFSDGTKRCKFVGLNFKKVERITDYMDNDITKDVKLLYQKLLENYHNLDLNDQEKVIKIVVEKWKRAKVEVYINKPEIEFMISPHKRANWVGMEYYPIGWDYYDESVPEYKLNHKNYIGEHLRESESAYSLKYRIYRNKLDVITLESALPLTFIDYELNINHKNFTSRWQTDGKEIYYVYDCRVYKYTEFGYGDEVDPHEAGFLKLKPFTWLTSRKKYNGTEITELQAKLIEDKLDRLIKRDMQLEYLKYK